MHLHMSKWMVDKEGSGMGQFPNPSQTTTAMGKPWQFGNNTAQRELDAHKRTQTHCGPMRWTQGQIWCHEPIASTLGLKVSWTSTCHSPHIGELGKCIQPCAPMCKKPTYWPKRHGAHCKTPPWSTWKTPNWVPAEARPLVKQSDPSTLGG